MFRVIKCWLVMRQVFINRPFSWNFFVKLHDSELFEALWPCCCTGRQKQRNLPRPGAAFGRRTRTSPVFMRSQRWPRAQVEQLDEEKDFDPCGLEEVRVLKLGDTLNLVVLVSLRKIELLMGNVQKQTAFDSWVNVCVCVSRSFAPYHGFGFPLVSLSKRGFEMHGNPFCGDAGAGVLCPFFSSVLTRDTRSLHPRFAKSC